MTSRQSNNLLTGGAILIGIATVAIVIAALLLPIEPAAEEAILHGRSPVDSSPPPASQPAGLDRLSARSFRTALDDVPAGSVSKPASATPSVAARPLQINVAGTIGNSVALLRLADGSVIARGAGDLIDGAEIIRIGAASVTLRRNGQDFTIAKPAAPDPSAGLIVIR